MIESENDVGGMNKLLLEQWILNDNHRVRDQQIKEAFKRVENKMESKAGRIDAMFSGTTCVMTFFNNEMIVCANSGDSRAILISEHENQMEGMMPKYYFT